MEQYVKTDQQHLIFPSLLGVISCLYLFFGVDMILLKKIREEYKNAMKARDVVKKEILNFLLSQIKNKEIESRQELSDDTILKIIKKEIKSRKETIDFLKQAGKNEDIIKEQQKIDILRIYLPEMLSEEKLKKIIEEYREKLCIDDLKKQRGQLIGAIMKEYGAQIDGALLNTIISSLI